MESVLKLGQIFQSISAWQKLSNIALKPKLAYTLLKYTQKVTSEHEIAEKQRIALIREITKTKDGEDAEIKPGTPAFMEYAERFSEITAIDSSLEPLDMIFWCVVEAVDEKDESLTMQDLAVLEPFFVSSEVESLDER